MAEAVSNFGVFNLGGKLNCFLSTVHIRYEVVPFIERRQLPKCVGSSFNYK